MAGKSDESAIRDWCIAYLAKSLNHAPEQINPDAKFARLGLDSAASVFLAVDLEEWLNVEVSAETLFAHPTINKLARHLATAGAADPALAPQKS